MRGEDKLHEEYSKYYFSTRELCLCPGCTNRKERLGKERTRGYQPPTEEEYAEYLQWKAEKAEQRSREAAGKRQEEQEREAQARVKKERERQARIKRTEERARVAQAKIKELRSKEATRRAREQQEKDAKIRIAKSQVKDKYYSHIQSLQERGDAVGTEEIMVDIGWSKKKGATECLFCNEAIKYYSFHCPERSAVACNQCKNAMSRFAPDPLDEDQSLVDGVEMVNCTVEEGIKDKENK